MDEFEDNFPSNEGDYAGLRAGRDAFIGYALGSFVDRTRFGIWFNNNKIIDWIYKGIYLAVILGIISFIVAIPIIVIAQS